MEIVEGDYDGLVLIMSKLAGIKDRQAETDKMFEPLKEAMMLLKVYNHPMEEKVFAQLEELPEKWGTTKKTAFQVKATVRVSFEE